MKIMILAQGYPTKKYPGNGIFEFDQAKALQKQGTDVVYAVVDIRSLRRWRKWGFEKKIIEGVKVYAINIPIGRMPSIIKKAAGVLGARLLYKKILQNEEVPSIIHAHFTFEGYLAGVLKKKFESPVVLTEHSSKILATPIDAYTRNLAKKAYEKADSLIVVSSALQKVIFDTFSIRASVIPNIIDTESFCYQPVPSDLNKDIIQVVSAGNLIKSKRHDATIRALANVIELHPNIQLTIFGEGPERTQLIELIARLGVKNHVNMPGHLTRMELAEAFQNADFFVLPSAYETFGLVYVEAMATGLPVIATRCSGPEDFVTPENGLLVPVDNMEALEDAMAYMIKNHQQFDRVKIAANIKKRFSPDTIAGALLELYQATLSQSRKEQK